MAAPDPDRSVPLEVLPGLYIGNLRASRNRAFLDERGITHILTVAPDLPPEFPKRYTYKIVNVDDDTDDDLARHFDRCCHFIDKARRAGGGGVLVHWCASSSVSLKHSRGWAWGLAS